MKTKFRFLYFLLPVAMMSAGTGILMALWNWLMPSLFGSGTITFIQALGILVLARILTWGGRWFWWMRWNRFAYATSGGYHHCHPYSHHHDSWRMKMKEKWDNMTPEEKEKWGNRCSGWSKNEETENKEGIKA
jgi:hypothetical protein